MKFALSLFAILFLSSSSWAGKACRKMYSSRGKTPEVVSFSMAGVQIGSVTDKTQSTGATVIYFPEGAHAQYDARGGSVAAVETTLLDPGSYSHSIDALVFSGGSTMGLAASDGVRSVLFERRQDSESFDFIPSVPGAVVYDFGGRIHSDQDKRVYPTHQMGRDLMANLSDRQFLMGRAGAGVSTSCNKVCSPVWGGQGMVSTKIKIGKKTYTLMAVVVLNAVGDVKLGTDSYTKNFEPIRELREKEENPGPVVKIPNGNKQNTTLSAIITDVPLDRSQLKRLATMVHTSMGRNIFPFHALTDGDIQFAVTTGGDKAKYPYIEDQLGPALADLMSQALLGAVKFSNDPVKKTGDN